jgi:hypothetical protein
VARSRVARRSFRAIGVGTPPAPSPLVLRLLAEEVLRVLEVKTARDHELASARTRKETPCLENPEG